ncbi:hypothetical protein AVEN_102371-1 [Araneus ventricosus]|uniref:Tc1-like transposase DDE domain-containing protein n=1 Tax=Araneus ventricosus TaxID=182803 RepID=A0A4Y2T2J5_ARAVE|nr:hypothetical protein AVEN_102371-1 [Araneus ventricosus]
MLKNFCCYHILRTCPECLFQKEKDISEKNHMKVVLAPIKKYPQILGTVQSDGASVMVWDVCSLHDMGPLIRLERTLTGDRYLSILSDHLHSFMSIVHCNGLGQFQQDNATFHASRVSTKWLQEHSSDFRHFHWSPKFPDMDII